MRSSMIVACTIAIAIAGCPGRPDQPRPRAQRSGVDDTTPRERHGPRARAAPRKKPNVYAFKGFRFEVSVVPERKKLMVGEPIYLTFEVLNRSGSSFQLYWGGDYRNRLGRPESYRVRVRRLDQKKPLPLINAGPNFGGLGGARRIGPGNKFSRDLFLPSWAHITAPGRYEILCKRTLHIDPITPRKLGPKQKEKGILVTARAVVTITPTNKARMGALIKELAGILLGQNHDTATKAGRALAAIRDVRVIPYMVSAYKLKGYSRRMLAVRVLGRFATDAALAGLKLCMKDSSSAIRHTCAISLSYSKHPKAHALLLSMRNDPAQAVRITILHALGKMKCTQSKPLLRKMTKDADKVVRTEAKRYLKLCRKKPRP